MSALFIDRMRQRAAIVQAVRRFFDEAGFIEVDTPVALTAPAPELHIEAPLVDFGPGTGRRYLQPSPELPMKRLLAGGLERIYQIAPVFRCEEASPCHCPEFRLLEWYRRDAGWESLLEDCEGLLRTTALAAGRGASFLYQGDTIDLATPFRRASVDEVFRATVGFSILDYLDAESLRKQLRRRDIVHDAGDSWNDLFHRVFLGYVEPELRRDPRPLFLTDYPAPLCSLARLSPTDPRVSERFELFVARIELANGFGELTHPREQERRFAEERARRRAAGMHDYPIDHRFLAALANLPPSAGIALGFDRLLMLLLDANHLDEVSFIPWRET